MADQSEFVLAGSGVMVFENGELFLSLMYLVHQFFNIVQRRIT